MSKNQIELSIIVPVYNVEMYVKECLQSLVNQTLDKDNYEIIIVNDGSKDKSLEICKEFEEKYDYVKLISQENKGLGAARNLGIKNSRGMYIGFVDSDDYVREDMFEKLLNCAKKDDVDMVICNTARYLEKDKKIVNFPTGLEENKIYNNEELIETYLSGKIVSMAWNKIYKRHLFDDISFDEGIYYEDIYPAYKLIEKSKTAKKIDDYLYIYRIREGNITSSFDDKKIKDLNSVILRVDKDYKKKSNFNRKLLDAFDISYLQLSLDLYIKNMNYSYKKIYKNFNNYYKEYNIPNLISIIFNKYMKRIMKLKYILFKLRILPLIKKIRSR